MLKFVVLLLATAGLCCAAESAAVDWQPWGPATFARAKAEGKLVLLDNAAEWCHWCHVMDRVTYHDPAVTALIAQRFIAVKVDVDAHPDLAERYGEWGWPATIVFSPSMDEIKKLRGYFEPKLFRDVLADAVDQSDRTGGKGPFRPPERAAGPAAAGELTPGAVQSLRDKWEAELQGYFDPKGGGWGYRQKSSTWMNVEHALVRHAATQKPYWEWRATMTLDRLTRIMDSVWGGVYQYSTDGDWEHPHFEKLMTYQAGTLESYVRAALATGQAGYLDTAKKLHGYIAEFLRAPDGAYLVSQDADLSGGMDGHAYYALPDAARRKAGLPRVDTHEYARENGLAIAATVLLAQATQDDLLVAEATRAAERVLGTHALRGGVSHAESPAPDALLHLADNAAFGRGLLALYEATGEARWLAAARAVADALKRELFDDATGAFFAHSADAQAVGALKERRRPVDDNVDAGRFFLRLAIHEDSDARRAVAARTLRWLSAGERPRELGRFIGSYLTFLEESSADPLHVKVVGPAAAPGTRALLAAALRLRHPFAIVRLEPSAGTPAAFGCTGSRCTPPIQDPARLIKLLK